METMKTTKNKKRVFPQSIAEKSGYPRKIEIPRRKERKKKKKPKRRIRADVAAESGRHSVEMYSKH